MRIRKDQNTCARAMAELYRDVFRWCPIPIPEGRKGPILTDWPNFKLKDGYRWKDPGVGIILGAKSGGLVDADLDAPEALEFAPLVLPKTPFIFGRDSSWRSHYLYRIIDLKGKQPLALKDPEIGDVLIELRLSHQKNGEFRAQQTLFPPSIHPSGEPIEWVDLTVLINQDPPEIPFEQLARSVKLLGAAVLVSRRWKRGCRHLLSLAWAGALARAGIDRRMSLKLTRAVCLTTGDEEIDDRLQAVSDTYRRIALGEPITGSARLAELIGEPVAKRLFQWLEMEGSGSDRMPLTTTEKWPRPIPLDNAKLENWPQDVFPEPLQSFGDHLAKFTETPIELAALMLLSALGTIVQGKYKVEVKKDYFEPLAIWCLVTMPSGGRKSAVLNPVMQPIKDWQRQQKQEMVQEILIKTSHYETEKARIDEMRKKAAKLDSSKDARELEEKIAELESSLPRIPTAPRLITSDITPEHLASLMAQNYDRMGIISDEGGIFETINGRYSRGIPNLDIFLKGHSGSPVFVDRGTRPSISLDWPAISFGLAVQEEVLRGLTKHPEMRGRGLLARFLYAVPQSFLGYRENDGPPIPPELKKKFSTVMTQLINLPWQTDSLGGVEPYILRLSAAAKSVWKKFQAEVEISMRPGRRCEYIQDWAGKLPGQVARVAGLLHIARWAKDKPESHPIDQETMEAAVRIGQVLTNHALVAFDAMGADPTLDGARAVLQWIKRNDQDVFSFRDAHYSLKSRFRNRADLAPCMALLEERYYVRHRQTMEPKAHGKPSEKYEVNPLVLGRSDE